MFFGALRCTVDPAALLGARSGQMAPLSDAINTLAAFVSQHVLTLIMDKHQLMVHLRAIKKYLLLGQGDFVQHLMDLTWFVGLPSCARLGCVIRAHGPLGGRRATSLREELWKKEAHSDHHWAGTSSTPCKKAKQCGPRLTLTSEPSLPSPPLFPRHSAKRDPAFERPVRPERGARPAPRLPDAGM